MKLSIVIPAYNEEATIERVIRRVQAVDLGAIEKEIIVVDDGSRDGTGRILQAIPNIRHLTHTRNVGKGAALTTGFRAATGDIILIQDADLEYDPQDYAAVIQPIVEGRADAVIGSRFILYRMTFFGNRRSPYLSHYLGNLLVTTITNLLYGQRFTDYEGCYKAFRRSLVASTPISATGFEFDNELMCKLFRKGARVVEVPIRYTPRTYESGKKITWRHGLIMLWTIIKWRARTL
jgi:glycosyltransferase involved in cell wall biosynthesis